MAMACEICTRTYNSESVDSIDADSLDVESSDVGIPSLSSILHTIIQHSPQFSVHVYCDQTAGWAQATLY